VTIQNLRSLFTLLLRGLVRDSERLLHGFCGRSRACSTTHFNILTRTGAWARDWNRFTLLCHELVEARQVGLTKTGIERTGKRLTAGDEGSSPPSAIAVFVLCLIGVFLNICLDNLLDITNFDQDVLGLEIGMDDATFAVEVVETQ